MVTYADHNVFMSMIGYYYNIPVETAQDYVNIYNAAIISNCEIIAILFDGVVYKDLNQA